MSKFVYFIPAILAAASLTSCPVFAQAAAGDSEDEFGRYADFDADSRITIDYSALDDILDGIVFEVGMSDRAPARSRSIRTGTRISLENNSRYRYEGNRVVFHALEPVHTEAITLYRRELESLPALIGLERLSDNEQLAFWLNLHNVVVVDEIAKRYPTRSINRIQIDGVPFHDADIIDLGDTRISLNDIRFNIVGALYDNPLVIYGFYSGAVGGPTLQSEAFTGRTVWSQLSANAREFVNALRGVESADYGFRVSTLYYEWREVLFPSWPSDLRNHLRAFAEGETRASLDYPGDPDFLRYDWNIADLTNGVGRCGGRSTFNVVSVSGEMGQTGERGCSTLPPHAMDFVVTIQERRLEFLRQGRLGSVTVRDLDSPDPDDEDGRASNARRITVDGDPITADDDLP